MHMWHTANIIIKDVIHIFASISKIMRILLMGRRNRERWSVVEWKMLLFVTKVLVIDLYLIEKVLDVLDVFQVLRVRAKYPDAFNTPFLPCHLVLTVTIFTIKNVCKFILMTKCNAWFLTCFHASTLPSNYRWMTMNACMEGGMDGWNNYT